VDIFGIVYIIRNSVNDKVYVGQTSMVLSIRWAKHKSAARRGRISFINSAIRAHGEDVFTIEVIYEAKDALDLNAAERRFISLYKSNTREFGYNVSEGGNNINRMMGESNPRYAKNLSEGEKEKHASAIKQGLAEMRARGKTQKYPAVSEKRKKVLADRSKGNKYASFPKSEEHRLKISDAQKKYWAGVRSAKESVLGRGEEIGYFSRKECLRAPLVSLIPSTKYQVRAVVLSSLTSC
jgi:group I intron endonuclease